MCQKNKQISAISVRLKPITANPIRDKWDTYVWTALDLQVNRLTLVKTGAQFVASLQIAASFQKRHEWWSSILAPCRLIPEQQSEGK